MRLFAVLEMLAARANPIFAFDDDARELAVGFEREVLEQRELIQNVGLDGLPNFARVSDSCKISVSSLRNAACSGTPECLRSFP